MLNQIVRRHGLATLGKIARRSVEPAGKHRDSPCRQQGIVRQIAHAHRQIKTLAEQIDPAWRQVEFKRYRRVQGNERREHIAEQQHGKIARHRHSQATAWPHLPVLAQRLDSIDFGGNLTGMFQQLVAKLGQRQASRGSQQQSFAQPFFKQRNPPRYGRFGQADSLGSTAEAPGFNHPGKDQ